jgi:TonB family protein
MQKLKTILPLASLLLLSAAPSIAQDYQQDYQQGYSQPETQPRQPFSLKATVTDKVPLTRGEIDPSAVGMGTLSSPNKRISALPMQEAIPAPTIPPSQPMAPQEDTGKMLEFDVDWSRWMSGMADRWFYVLRTAEYNMGIQFHTPRPALIQFTCYADGTIRNISLKQSSGVAEYDRLQMQTLTQICPLPPFPAGSKRTHLTLVQGWESHPRKPGEDDFQPGSFGRGFPQEKVRKWVAGR